MMSDDVLPQLCRAAYVLVVGTKNDLDDGDREVSEQDGKVSPLSGLTLVPVQAYAYSDPLRGGMFREILKQED